VTAQPASSLGAVRYSQIREIAEEAMRMEGVLALYFGESNRPTPQFVKDAAAQAMADGFTLYTSNAGLPSLREGLADYYRRLRGIELDPLREIVVHASGVQALAVAIRCLLDPGDEAIILTPVWPNGAGAVAMANATPVEVEQPLVDGRYAIDVDAIAAAITPRTRFVLLTSPSNPLGWVATDEELQALLELCRERGLWLLCDEVYERLYWRDGRLGEPAPSVLTHAMRDDAVIVTQSFSKSYCMTGWRVGWIVARADLAAKAMQLNEITVSCAAGFAQKAAEAALAHGEPSLLELLEDLKASRDLCLDGLRTMPGVTVPEPDGAFYLFPRIEGLGDSLEFCRALLREEKVGLAPGKAFGKGGDGSVRLCYASERHILEEALERLGRFVERR